jgi:predicted nucleotidyltransferase component of viral defense system
VIHQNVIKRRADDDGLPAPAVERDYVLAHVLTAISERDHEQQLVFKGGTSLRLCHFENYRYSADLDFSLTGGVSAEDATRRRPPRRQAALREARPGARRARR